MQNERFPYFLIDLMKSVIKDEPLVSEKASELIYQLENCGEQSSEVEYMLDTAKWLQTVINNKDKSNE